jgi:hypothetical protein
MLQPDIKTMRHKHDSLGVVLEGSDLIDSGLPVHFKGVLISATLSPNSGCCQNHKQAPQFARLKSLLKVPKS